MRPKRRRRLELAPGTCVGRLKPGRGHSIGQQIPTGPKYVINATEQFGPTGRWQWNLGGRVGVRAASGSATTTKRWQQLPSVLAISTLVVVVVAQLVTLPMSSQAQVLLAEDESSVVISSRQGQLFRGLKMPGGGGGGDGDGDARQSGQVVAFLGLRYASAPVKRLRFMPPTPFNYATRQFASNGNGNKSDLSDQLRSQAHDMRHFGPICMQRLPMEPTREQMQAQPNAQGNNLRSRRAQLQLSLMDRLLAPSLSGSWRPLVRKLTSRFVQSEDCLNLNIYTPIEALKRAPATDRRQSTELDPAEPLRPVLVLIHGQSFDFGAGSALDGRRFAQNNRQVVITLNYRLHILGFPPRLGAGSRANLGLLDQVAALHWIQANVRSFGGSPTKITLLGAKGGAIFVNLLMLSPLTRGLFRRAVLEDGTALSPVIANNMALSSASSMAPPPTAAAAGQLVNQHARLLAQLNDCPADSSTATGQDQDLWLGLTIECLKSKPAELLMRHLPVELIDTTRPALVSGSSIPLAPKWLRPLKQALDLLVKEELQLRLDKDEKGEATNETVGQMGTGERRQQMEQLKRVFVAASNEESAVVSMDLQQLNKLIALMISRFLQSPQSATTQSNSSPTTTSGGGGNDDNEDQTKLMALLTEILGAIYLPSNKTLPVGPLYAPQLEPGLILADSSHGQDHHQLELASSMLQRNSPFARRDLMIGLTRSLIDFDEQLDARDEGALHLAPGLSSRRLLQLGLTEAEAIGQVNLFVQSFYRYHQQEISNSIISHYLSRKSSSGGNSQANNNLTMGQRQPMSLERLQKQQFLAKAVRELYQHSLIDIPLIKTALIHSLQQLETMADLFVSQQVVKLEEAQRNSDHDHEELEQLIDERHLEDEFHNYAKGLYQNQDRWPIRLVPVVSSASQSIGSGQSSSQVAGGQSENSIQSTFLFQIGAKFSWLRQRLQTTLKRLSSPTGLTNEPAAIRSVLARFLEEISSEKFQRHTTGNWFECSFVNLFEDWDEEEPAESGGDELELDSNLSRNQSIWHRFRAWICRRRLERRLANFVETGNVNQAGIGLQEPSSPANSNLAQECSSSLAESARTNLDQDHHHLVQLYELDASPKLDNNNFEILIERSKKTPVGPSSCRRRLEQVAFEQLLDQQDQAQDSTEQAPAWNVFNVFTQQLANLFSGPPPNESNWSLDSFISSTSSSGAFDAKIAFWANFVGALNCSRTQPIGAGSLSLFSQVNSTLLNMNLNLNCQQQQQTANLALQSIGQRIKRELSQQVAVWRRHRASKSRVGQLVANLSSNHHSLRMANMSTNNHQQDQHQQQQHQHQLEEGQAELTVAVATEAPSGAGINLLTSWLRLDNGPAALRKLSNKQLTPLVAVWSLGVLVTVISISLIAGFVLVLRRHRDRRKRPADAKQHTKETTSAKEFKETNCSQLDVGQLFEQADQKMPSELMSYNTQQQQDNRDPSPNSVQYGNGHLLHYHLHETANQLETDQEQEEDADNALELLAPAEFVHHHHSVQYDQLANGDQLNRSNRNGNFAASDNQTADLARDHHQPNQHHLPTCNLMLLRQHQNQPLLSSSSETTSTTNQPRAQSSVSLVSTLMATPTNETDRQPATVSVTKKRVKISDPKQVGSNWADDHQPIHLPNGPVLHLSNGLGELSGELHTLQLNQFCPIHRSNSNLNLMNNQSNNGLELVNGTHSLMRHHYNNNNYASQQQRAVRQHENSFQQVANGLQVELCAAHNFQRQQQVAQVGSENFYQARQ